MTEAEDYNQLQLLSIFQYILGGFTILFACFPIIHVGMGVFMVSGGFNDPQLQGPPQAMGWFFILIPGLMILMGWTLGVCMILCGRKLTARVNWTFCIIVAGIECLMMPFGTVLGVFTIMVLNRESVRDMFHL